MPAPLPDRRCEPPAPKAEIARRNGARSNGPVTAAGKARSARNAVRHGLCARTMDLGKGEDAAALAELRAAMRVRCQPLDATEAHWVDELVSVAWRQRRLRGLEDTVLAAAGLPEAAASLPSLATLIRYRGRLDRDWRRATEELAILQAGRSSLADSARLHGLATRLGQPAAVTAEPEAVPASEVAVGTNEPTDSRQTAAAAPDTPRHAVPPLPEACTNEPTAPAAPLNRQQRRRLAALARQALRRAA